MTAVDTATTPTGPGGCLDERARILLVDDEPALVRSLRRNLTSHFRVDTETDPQAVLGRLDDMPDLAVIVSDMRMPGMDGATLLSHVATRRPDVTRILLTGLAELEAATAAVNRGRIFRFLSKPIPPDELIGCLHDAVRQYRLVHAERDILERTLRGSVQALVDTLAMASPTAFARATRMRTRLIDLAEAIGASDLWEIEVAGLLSHIGAVTLPVALTERLADGATLSAREQELVDGLPAAAVALLADIPRLESVRRIISLSPQRFDGRGPVEFDVAGTDIPLGARLLHIVTDYDLLESRGTSVQEALSTMRSRHGTYDPALLDALGVLVEANNAREIVHVDVCGLRVGMELAAHLTTCDDKLLAAKGQRLNLRMIGRLIAWSRHTAIREPVAVHPTAAEPLDTPDRSAVAATGSRS